MADEVLEQAEAAEQAPDDYAAYEAWAAGQGMALENANPGKPETKNTAPATGDETTLPSEPAEVDETAAGQTAEASEATDVTEQEAAEGEEVEETTEQPEPEKDSRLARRMRKLTGEIKALQTQLAEATQQPEAVDEETGEELSPPEPAAAAAETPLKRPMLKDFEDSDTETVWDQYEAAMAAYLDAKSKADIEAALDRQKAELAKAEQEREFTRQKAVADAAWNQAAARYPDYNEVVRSEVQISAAMESVMRMDPTKGTELAYLLGQHPEESLEIAKQTLAHREQDWAPSMAKAAVLLTELRAKYGAAAPKGAAKPSTAVPPKLPPKAAAAAPAKPALAVPPKKVSSAKQPPTQIRSGGVAPKFDVHSEDEATDYAKWEREMEARQAARNGGRK